VSPYILNSDPRFFASPDGFDPDRWLRPSGSHRSAYLPFGAGNRKCIGDLFALTEAQVAIATVAQRWRVTQYPGTPPVRARVRMSLRPDQLVVAPVRRQPAPAEQHGEAGI
jgi:cytochrome P450